MTIDFTQVIDSETARVVAALEANGGARIPWSDTWTVAECARHVSAVHHVVTGVIEGRPTASFSLFKTLEMPELDDPSLTTWVQRGASEVVATMRATDPGADCWSWWPEGRTAGFWQRRMAHETLVHRWDVELGAGIDRAPMDPAVAADALDEFLDVFVTGGRLRGDAPAASPIALACTDTDDSWLLELPAASRVLTRGGGDGASATLRGTAEALLLFAWGRTRFGDPDLGVTADGDASVLSRWAELVPPI